MEGGPPDFPRDSSCPAVLWIQPDYDPFQIRGSHTLWPAFPCRSFKNRFSLKLSVTPKILLPSVWPPPLSLATTRGISVDVFSSPYLDVSVQAVPFLHPFDSMQDDWILSSRVAPFGNLRIKGYLLLPVAFRSLSRLSSALSAKASTLRSFLLDLVYSFYSVRNWVFAFNNADRIASILNFRSFGLVVNFVYDILGCLDKKSFSSKSSV